MSIKKILGDLINVSKSLEMLSEYTEQDNDVISCTVSLIKNSLESSIDELDKMSIEE